MGEIQCACCTNCGTRKGINLYAALAIKKKYMLLFFLPVDTYLLGLSVLPCPAKANVPLFVQQASVVHKAGSRGCKGLMDQLLGHVEN